MRPESDLVVSLPSEGETQCQDRPVPEVRWPESERVKLMCPEKQDASTHVPARRGAWQLLLTSDQFHWCRNPVFQLVCGAVILFLSFQVLFLLESLSPWSSRQALIRPSKAFEQPNPLLLILHSNLASSTALLPFPSSPSSLPPIRLLVGFKESLFSRKPLEPKPCLSSSSQGVSVTISIWSTKGTCIFLSSCCGELQFLVWAALI